MKAILTNENSFRTLETLENDSTFKCRYTGGTKYPFNDFNTKVPMSFEEGITVLIKDGYTLEYIEKWGEQNEIQLLHRLQRNEIYR